MIHWLDNVISIDTETTGLSEKAEIVEIAAVHYYQGRKVREWSTFCMPVLAKKDDPDVVRALEVNKIEWDYLVYNAFTFRKQVDRIYEELSDVVWVAHNMEFDLRMIRSEFKRQGRDLAFPHVAVCTKLLDCLFNPGQNSYKLVDVAQRWHVPQVDAHRALVDAQVCGQVFVNMIAAGRLPPTMEEGTRLLQEGERAWRNRPRFGRR